MSNGGTGCNSNGGILMVEQQWWNSHGGTVMVEQ